MDPDAFWHLRVADQLFTEGVHPLVDRLSFASIQSPWTPYSWLAELGMKSIWDAGGYRAALGAQAAMQAAIVLFVALACRSARAAETSSRFLPVAAASIDEGRDAPEICAALAVAFAAFFCLPFLSFRPVTAALVLLAACAWLFVRDRRLEERSRLMWGVVPLTALLANVHLYVVFIPLWSAALLAGRCGSDGASPARRSAAKPIDASAATSC